MSSLVNLIERIDRKDALRYRYLCANPDWTFIERLCQQFSADSAVEFKRQLDAEIDRYMASSVEAS